MITLGRIETTKAKAVAVRPDLEKLVGLAKKDSLNNRRLANRILGGEKDLDKLFKQVGPAFNQVQSGFTRIIPLAPRFSDSSKMVIFEFTRAPVVTQVIKPEIKVEKEVTQDKIARTKKEVLSKTKKERKVSNAKKSQNND